MAAEPSTRADLLASYGRPYARWLPSLYALNRVVPALAAVAALWIAAGAWSVAGDVPDVLVSLAVLSTVLWALWTAWVTVGGVAIIRDRTAEWRAHDRSELARVREHR